MIILLSFLNKKLMVSHLVFPPGFPTLVKQLQEKFVQVELSQGIHLFLHKNLLG